VTLLLGCGLVVGPSVLNVIPSEATAWYEFLSVVALTMVAFLLGGSLTRENLERNGRTILLVSLSIVVVTLAVVALGLWAIGLPAPAALVLGAIATATAPAATQDAIRQSGASGPFVDMIKGVVAIDDAWGLLVFSFAAVAAHWLGGQMQFDLLVHAASEIVGAVVLGVAIGLPASYLTGRLSKGEPLQTEALGIVFLTAGISIWLGVSFLIAGMTAGAVISNVARHHDRAFHEIEHIQWPFMMLFFLLAGASLDLAMLWEVGLIGVAFVLLRSLSRVIGGWIGSALAGAPLAQRHWYGIALLPQAGVAVGMALVAAREFPGVAEMILTLTIATTVVFEIVGPAATLMAIRRVQALSRSAGGKA